MFYIWDPHERKQTSSFKLLRSSHNATISYQDILIFSLVHVKYFRYFSKSSTFTRYLVSSSGLTSQDTCLQMTLTLAPHQTTFIINHVLLLINNRNCFLHQTVVTSPWQSPAHSLLVTHKHSFNMKI